MTCESCGIENPTSAAKCDCGHVLGEPKRYRAEIDKQPLGIVTTVTRVVFIAPFLGSMYGAQYFYANWNVQTSAPQQAALAGYVLACAVLPYCFARAFAGMTGKR